MLPNMRLKLAGVIVLREAKCCRLAGRGLRPTALRAAGRGPQLKRDPLGSAMMSRKLPRPFQLLPVLAPLCLSAQQPPALPQLDSGTVVRLQLRSGNSVKGKLLAPFAAESARFRYCTYPAPPCQVGSDRYREQPAANVASWQVRRGTRAVPGLVVGGVLGVWLGFEAVDFAESVGESKLSSGERRRTIAVSTLAIGALGYLIGAGLDKWASPR